MYSTILFDLNGTLTDSSPGIINSVIYAVNKYGIDAAGNPKLKKFLGPPLVDSFKNYFDFTDESAAEAVTFYREYFSTKGLLENAVYNGITELLDHLKSLDKKLIVATSKPEPFTNRILEHFDLMKYFDFAAGSKLDNTRCKKAEVISYALSSCNITDLSDVVMIGDREHDIIGANDIGIDSIGVLYGYGSLQELRAAGATHIAKNTDDILNIIKNI